VEELPLLLEPPPPGVLDTSGGGLDVVRLDPVVEPRISEVEAYPPGAMFPTTGFRTPPAIMFLKSSRVVVSTYSGTSPLDVGSYFWRIFSYAAATSSARLPPSFIVTTGLYFSGT
jgi:hypothetical protein